MTWVFSVLAFVVPPSAAYAYGLWLQLKHEAAKKMNAEQQEALMDHTRWIEVLQSKVNDLEHLTAQQQQTINRVAEREF